MTSTTIRVTTATRDRLNALAAQRSESVTDTVARAAELLEQESIGEELARDLREDELDWLNAAAR